MTILIQTTVYRCSVTLRGAAAVTTRNAPRQKESAYCVLRTENILVTNKLVRSDGRLVEHYRPHPPTPPHLFPPPPTCAREGPNARLRLIALALSRAPGIGATTLCDTLAPCNRSTRT